VEGLGVNKRFWQARRVFLTGHTGFKGGWLSLWLQKLGAEVTGYALPPSTHPNIFEEARVGAGMASHIGDIRDGVKLMTAIQEAAPEVIIHMAAQPLVRRSYLDPVETYSINVMGTVNLLEAVRKCASVRAVVNVTSDKCYENKEWHRPYREYDAMGGYDPYSSSKGCSELVTSAYRNSYFNGITAVQHQVALASARAGNVIGGGDWSKDRLIPDMFKAIARGEPVLIRNPQAVRPWQHVLEPLRGYLILAERLFEGGTEYAEAFNFGPRENDVRSVEWIVNRLANIWGETTKWQLDGSHHPHEATLLQLEVTKASDRLGWMPTLSLDEALQLTADWTRASIERRDMNAFTISQIDSYLKMVYSIKSQQKKAK
jgi:CDP-glucose 4,6-dehydratase